MHATTPSTTRSPRREAAKPYKLRIQGADELYTEHESVMLESCNTSFQVHLQVEPDEFRDIYNVAQVMTAPVMAAAVNSPVLFGKHLWKETRIALFQQSIDTRRGSVHMRDMSPRVRFGEDWVHKGVTDLVQEDIARFRVLLTKESLRGPPRGAGQRGNSRRWRRSASTMEPSIGGTGPATESAAGSRISESSAV